MDRLLQDTLSSAYLAQLTVIDELPEGVRVALNQPCPPVPVWNHAAAFGLIVTLLAAEWLDLSNSESPEFIGRVIAALAQSSKLEERTGQVLVAAALALELGVTDIDGRQLKPLTLETV